MTGVTSASGCLSRDGGCSEERDAICPRERDFNGTATGRRPPEFSPPSPALQGKAMESKEEVRSDMREFLNRMPMGKKQWVVFRVCCAATAIEGFDTIVSGFIAPAISQSWKLSSAARSPLVAIGLFGLLIGSIVGGTLAD